MNDKEKLRFLRRKKRIVLYPSVCFPRGFEDKLFGEFLSLLFLQEPYDEQQDDDRIYDGKQ